MCLDIILQKQIRYCNQRIVWNFFNYYLLQQQVLCYHLLFQMMRKSKGFLKSMTFIHLNQNSSCSIQPKDEKNEQQQQRLKTLITKFKANRILKNYVSKISRNNPFRSSQSFQQFGQKAHLQSSQSQRPIKGILLDNGTKSILIITELLATLTLFIVYTFYCYFIEFRQQFYNINSGIGVLNVGILLILLIQLGSSIVCIKMKYTSQLETIRQIIIFRIKSLQFYINLTIIICLALNIFFVNLILGVIIMILSPIKLFNSIKKLEIFETTLINNFVKLQYWNLFKVITFNFFFAHLLANLLLAMALISEDNWLAYKQINQEPWFVQYLWSYYWSITIMMTVGFGDFLPSTYKEATIVGIMELFSCMILAYNISEVSNILNTLRKSNQQILIKLSVLRRMQLQDGVSNSITKQITGFLLETQKIKMMSQYDQRNQLLQSLPIHLKRKYMIQANKRLFKSIPFFNCMQKDILIQIAQKCEGKIFFCDQNLLQDIAKNIKTKQKMQKANLYLHKEVLLMLKSGVVGYAYMKKNSIHDRKVLQKIEVKEKNFQTVLLNYNFLNLHRAINYYMIAQSYCLVNCLKYQDFYNIIKENELVFGYYFTQQHKIIMDEEDWETLKCSYCSFGYHTIFSCPKLSYMPNRGALFMRNCYKNKKKQKQQRGEGYYRFKNTNIFHTSPLKLQKTYFKPRANDPQEQVTTPTLRRMSSMKVPTVLINYISSNNIGGFRKYQAQQQTQRMKERMKTANITKYQEIIMKNIRKKYQKNKQISVSEWESNNPDPTQYEIDIAHNFIGYFGNNNPSHLVYFSLNQKARQKRKNKLFGSS